MEDNKSASLFQKEQVMESLKQSFVKLNPRVMIKNPIMFTVVSRNGCHADCLFPFIRYFGIWSVRI